MFVFIMNRNDIKLWPNSSSEVCNGMIFGFGSISETQLRAVRFLTTCDAEKSLDRVLDVPMLHLGHFVPRDAADSTSNQDDSVK